MTPTLTPLAEMAKAQPALKLLLDTAAFMRDETVLAENDLSTADADAIGGALLEQEMAVEMSAKGLGASAVVDANKKVLGIFTDGDLRRLIETGTDMRQLSAEQVMHANPRTVRSSALAAEAAELMELHRITSVLVVDERGTLCGALNTNDLMRAKVI